jgi:hypothetical protein
VEGRPFRLCQDAARSVTRRPVDDVLTSAYAAEYTESEVARGR